MEFFNASRPINEVKELLARVESDGSRRTYFSNVRI